MDGQMSIWWTLLLLRTSVVVMNIVDRQSEPATAVANFWRPSMMLTLRDSPRKRKEVVSEVRS